MKITNRLSLICASVTLALFVFVSSVFADAPVPKTPAQDATLDLRPVQTLEYKFPADRNWDDEYNPVELKENNRDENSHPTPVDFEWTAVEDPEAIYMLELSTDPNFSDDSAIGSKNGHSTTMWDSCCLLGKYHWLNSCNFLRLTRSRLSVSCS